MAEPIPDPEWPEATATAADAGDIRTARTSTARIRWRRRLTCGPRWTRSAGTSWRAARCSRRCGNCCGRARATVAGLDDLTRELWKRRRDLQRNNRIDGTLQEVRELLDKALTAEKAALARQDSDDARFRELDLETLPDSTARAVRALSEYDWQSAEGRQAYQDIKDLLGREMLDQRFSGMKQAMQQATPEDVQRIQQMLDDLNDLLAAHASGADTAGQFDEFMRKHGDFFPENPQSVDELVDVLAARSAAAQRMMQSLSAEQRAELAELSQQAFGDPRLGQSLSQLDAQLQNLRPGEDWSGSGRFRGDSPDGAG